MTPREIIAELLDRHLATSTVRPETFIRDLSAAGFVVIPREPTEAMLRAMAFRAWDDVDVERLKLMHAAAVEEWEKADV